MKQRVIKAIGILIPAVILVMLLAAGCGSGSKTRSVIKDRQGVEYAELLEIEKHEGYTRVDVKNGDGSGSAVATYILVPRDSAMPQRLPEGQVVRTPLNNIVAFSSVHANALKELGVLNAVKGVADAGYFTMSEILNGLNNGAITDVGNSSSPSVEKLMAMNTDGIIFNIYEGMDIENQSTFNLPYLKFEENLENTPLGKAEWIKFLGLLTGTEEKADSIFASTVMKYNEMSGLAKKAGMRPMVLTENMYEGVWYVPGGKSYAARLLEDAGADFPWSDTDKTASLALSLEEVLYKGGNADFWLIKHFGPLNKSSLLAEDRRYENLAPMRNGTVYYSDTSKSKLFDESAFHPELLLQDYLIIFHPELMHGKKLRYFQPIR